MGKMDGVLEILILKVLANSDEFYIGIYNAMDDKERRKLILDMENKSCANCDNVYCNVNFSSRNEKGEIIRPNNHSCFGWRNSILIGKARVLQR